jgi:chaperonin GroEL
MQGYTPKSLTFDSEAREKLAKGIALMAKAVKSTLGPLGKTVLLESKDHLRGLTVTKDGVTVARSIELLDPIENLAVRIMRDASERTASEAGDGTTTSVVIAEALIDAGRLCIEEGHNTTLVTRALTEISEDIIEQMRKSSVRMSKRRTLEVATISANNDKRVGKLIAETYNKVGRSGLVTVEMSKSHQTFTEVTAGMKLGVGYASPMFVNNHERDECVFKNAKVLVCDAEITNILSLETILKPIIAARERLVLIAPCSQQVINTLSANVMKNQLEFCVVPPPSFGFRRHEMMSDVAVSIGAKYFSEQTGDDLSIVGPEDLGRVEKIIVGRNSTTIIPEPRADEQKKVIAKRVSELKVQAAQTDDKNSRKHMQSRIATLDGGIGVIHAGGATDLEQKELYDRIDDAVCAVRAAIDSGVVAGGGVALAAAFERFIAKQVDEQSNSPEWNAAISMLGSATRAPLEQILTNAGMPSDAIDKARRDHMHKPDAGFGINLMTGQYGDMIALGVVDPLKVTTEALRNAVSVANTVLSTNAIVTLARSYETNR